MHTIITHYSTRIKSLVLGSLLLSAGAVVAQPTPMDAAGTGAKNVTQLTAVGNSLYYFGAEDGTGSFDYNLWKSDGTGSVKIMKMSTITANPLPSRPNDIGGKGYFFIDNNVDGHQPWVTDGTQAGTFMLKNIQPSSNSNNASSAATVSVKAVNFVSYKGKVYFAADNGNTNGNELWVTDGTSAGTALFMDLYPGYKASDPSSFIVAQDGYMYFTAKASSNAVKIWKTDGTVAGTSVIPFPSGVGIASELFLYRNNLYFGASTSNPRGSLYKTDGTTFTMIKDTVRPSVFDTINGKLVFADFVNLYDSSMYVSDGTPAGTERIKTGVLFSAPVRLGNKLFFAGTTAKTGSEPWITDGTAAGTQLLKEVVSGTQGGNITPANGGISNAFNGKVYFTALNASYASQLWETDGTPGGTKMTYDINPGKSAGVNFFTTLGSDLFFVAQNAATANTTKVFKLGTGATGLAERLSANQLSVYPNPSANGVFTVVLPGTANGIIKVCSLLGEEIYSERVTADNSMQTLNLSHLPNGMYLLRVINGKEICTQKIHIQK